MGASFILVDKPGSEALIVFSAPVGGPLASLRTEAVGLLHLLRKAKVRFCGAVPLLIFIDCLALLMILKKWGRSDFWPDLREVIHFDVIFPLLQELRQWTQQLTMVKVKSHSGCQLIEMADELADIGCASENEPICPGPQIYGSLRLRIQPSVREQIDCDKKGHPLPRDGAPNKALLKGVVAVNTQRNFATPSSLGRHCIVQTATRSAHVLPNVMTLLYDVR
jgi:ribonuclease HI